MKHKTATECWNMLRSELDSAIDRYVPMKKQWKRSSTICEKRLLGRLNINRRCGRYSSIREMIIITKYTKRP